MSDSFDPRRIEQAQAGNRPAMDRLLLDSYEPLVAHVLAQLPEDLRRATQVDDIVQLVFSQVFRDLHEFEVRGTGAWMAWLRAIADNRIRDSVRALHAKKRGGDFRQQGVGEAGIEFVNDLVGEYATTTATPSREVARAEAIEAIQLAIADLPPDHRNAIQLRYFEGCGIEEIAERLGKTSPAVRGLLDRARQKIRQTLQSASRYLSGK